MTTIETKQVLDQVSDISEIRYLRPASAARYISLSRARLYELINARQIKSHLIGGSRLIDRQELDRFVLAHSS